jgi:hypothetical protein
LKLHGRGLWLSYYFSLLAWGDDGHPAFCFLSCFNSKGEADIFVLVNSMSKVIMMSVGLIAHLHHSITGSSGTSLSKGECLIMIFIFNFSFVSFGWSFSLLICQDPKQQTLIGIMRILGYNKKQ